jgi:hypothetical protein
VTQVQYDDAKDVILDLLGWGVPPEYLVNCGLSREIIYYTFIELNLRLPASLDYTGLPPPLPLSYTYSSPEPISPSARTPDSRRTWDSPPAKRHIDAHPSLPKKPAILLETSSTDGPTLSATAAAFVPTATLSAIPMHSSDSPPPSLIDMEQQRRQELLARKAVLASRKKLVGTGSVKTQPTTENEPVPPPVATAAVDDFLNSIGSVNGDAASKDSTSIASSEDQMDVDEPIPGLSAGAVSPIISQPQLSATSSIASDTAVEKTITIPLPTKREGSVRSDSVERNLIPSTGGSSSSGATTPRPYSSRSRLPTKRPVAADFVDMEPSNSRMHPYHHYTVHNHTHARKKPASFAGLTHTRRMVIDLSDSEEEVEQAVNDRQLPASQQPSRPPTRLGMSLSLPTPGSTSSSSGLATPAALAEKEQEIKKMRELIARRERARLDKLAAVSDLFAKH